MSYYVKFVLQCYVKLNIMVMCLEGGNKVQTQRKWPQFALLRDNFTKKTCGGKDLDKG